jgi:L-2-hydroxyglutarate oxidase LhgO
MRLLDSSAYVAIRLSRQHMATSRRTWLSIAQVFRAIGVSRMANAKLDLTIMPFRGEYYEVVPAKHHYLNGLLYPVPDPQFPFLGVHFTKRIGGGIEASPNAVLALKREGYLKNSFDANDVSEYAKFRGFLDHGCKHWRMSVGEYHRSWSKAAFVRALQRLMPELTREDLVPGSSGVQRRPWISMEDLSTTSTLFIQTASSMFVTCRRPPLPRRSLLESTSLIQSSSTTDSIWGTDQAQLNYPKKSNL